MIDSVEEIDSVMAALLAILTGHRQEREV